MVLSIRVLAIFALLCWLCLNYLQLNIARIQLKTELRNKQMKCITKSDDQQLMKKNKEEKEKKKKDDDDDDDDDQDIDDQDIQENKNYQEICYEKDISYVWPIYLEDKLYLMSMDTTIPVSWMKGQKCHLEGSSKKCSFIQKNFKQNLKHTFSSHKKQKTTHSKEDYAMIEGSSQLIKGIYETPKKFSFRTRDTSRLANLYELLALGFYMAEEKETYVLENTLFINATQVSKNMNYLGDGAISLRFDQNSENSFLKELFNFQTNVGKVATIWVKDKNGLITIGDTSTKHSQNGYGGIQWVKIEEDEKFGKVPTITDVIIDSPNQQNFIEIHDQTYPAIISLSASYIGLPKNLMLKWQKKLSKKAGCTINNQTNRLQCNKLNDEDLKKVLTFVIDDKKISFTLQDLVIGKQHSKIILNLKQAPHETYAILGEPLFQKYLVLFDYGNNKVGFSIKTDQPRQLIHPLSIVRFICFVFCFGCSFIVCFVPVKRCIDNFKSRGYKPVTNQQTRRLKPYGPIQQNPYEELSSQIDEALKQ